MQIACLGLSKQGIFCSWAITNFSRNFSVDWCLNAIKERNSGLVNEERK